MAPLNRSVALGLAALAVFLVLFPLTLDKPGLPPHLKADEAAYYLAAQSLAFDHDLRVEVKDVDRAFREFPFGPVNNMILMTDDGWKTAYYGKPFLYPLAAAPFAALFGANGLLALNMLMTVGMIWMGTLYLRRYNSDATAALYSASFFLLGVGFSYAFWLQPEVFNMFGVAACLFFGWGREGRAGEPPGAGEGKRALLFAALSGAAILLPFYNKPMFGAIGLVPLLGYGRRKEWRALGAWLGAAALALGLATGVSVLLTGHPTSYLGVVRSGVTLCEPGVLTLPKPFVAPAAAPTAAAASDAPAVVPPQASASDSAPNPSAPGVAAPSTPATPHAAGATPPAGSSPAAQPAPAPQAPISRSWAWLIRVPEVTLWEELENIGYFLWGRHTGFILYTPFAFLSVVLFLLWSRRSLERWALLGVTSAIALFFLTFIAWNWQGGGGFVGNRYFVSAIPAFLFLVTEIRPRALVALGAALAGLFLGPILFTPFGAMVPEPTLQSHVRNAPFRYFPFELSLKNVPGYERVNLEDLRLIGRKDVFLPRGAEMWLRGASEAEVYFLSTRPIERAVFLLTNVAPANRVDVRFGEAREALTFEHGEEARRLDLRPGRPDQVRRSRAGTTYVYRLVVGTTEGRIRHWTREYPPNSCPYYTQTDRTEENFYVGAELSYLGTGRELEAEVYGVQWGDSVVPARVEAGSRFTTTTRVVNPNRAPWAAAGAARIFLSYHWLDANGGTVVRDGVRTPLPFAVPPGQRLDLQQNVVAPQQPGRYLLELDPVFESVAWFSEKNGGKTFRVPVEVVPATAPPSGTPPPSADAR